MSKSITLKRRPLLSHHSDLSLEPVAHNKRLSRISGYTQASVSFTLHFEGRKRPKRDDTSFFFVVLLFSIEFFLTGNGDLDSRNKRATLWRSHRARPLKVKCVLRPNIECMELSIPFPFSGLECHGTICIGL